jgi:ribulose-phosphate 3-epimerase
MNVFASPSPSSAIIAPSLLSIWTHTEGSAAAKQQACLAAAQQVHAANPQGWLHLDVMDGRYVPATTFGPELVALLRQHVPTAHLHVHLMTVMPDASLADYARAGATSLCFHPGTSANINKALAQLRRLGVQPGLALNLDEPAEALAPYAQHLHHALVLTVPAGAGGQAFMPEQLPKLTAVRAILPPAAQLVVDGGINLTTIRAAQQAGAGVFVAGSAIFGQPEWSKAIAALALAA